MAPPVRRSELRDSIANTLADLVKAYDLADVCVEFGLAPPQDDENPFNGKSRYVAARVRKKTTDELTDLARRIAVEYDAPDLERLIATLTQTAGGVAGELKNIIFAADGPKPRIVLRDALNNDIEIVEHADKCLVYDEPLLESGLSWRELVAWWRGKTAQSDAVERDVARGLYERLQRSLANEAEALILRSYAALYRTAGYDIPALVPQVYLHYDPYTRRELAGRTAPLTRQRMDFLLLFPQRVRVVVELDGKQHYADEAGAADPGRYAVMAAEDRSLRLAGYEVYRFGGHEIAERSNAGGQLKAFFEALLTRHAIALTEPPAPSSSAEPPF